MKKGISVFAITVLLVAGGIYVWRVNDVGECGLRFVASTDATADYFSRIVFETTDTKMGGHPIDSGYTPDMFMRTYPGFDPADFHCVEAEQGRYLVKDGQIDFHSTAGNRVSTAERAIARNGRARLLEHVARRLQMPFSTSAEVDAILARLAGDAQVRSSISMFGTYQETPAHDGLKAYQSDMFGVSFSYPERYLLFEAKGEGAEGREYYVITLVPDSPFIRDLMNGVHYDTEGPPSIHFSFYRERNRSVSLETWVRANWQSNFDPSDPAQSGVLTPISVAGVPALAYHYEGLWSVDAVAFAYRDWVVIAAADHSSASDDDPKLTELRDILVMLSVKR